MCPKCPGQSYRMGGDEYGYIKGAVARGALYVVVVGTQSGVIKSARRETLGKECTQGLAFHRHRTQQER